MPTEPFDRFSRAIAGDSWWWRNASRSLRDPRVPHCTGFLRTAADDTDENELNTLDIHFGVLQRRRSPTTCSAALKCHDHKYEPLLQKDFISSGTAQPRSARTAGQPKQRLSASRSPKESRRWHNAASKRSADLTARAEGA